MRRTFPSSRTDVSRVKDVPVLVYMIRHGQTDWNAESRLQGQKDIGLNALGRAQASANGTALAALLGDSKHSYDFVCSPLSRTRETMERARIAMHLPASGYRTDDRLVEISFGDWEGLTLTELKVRAPERLAARNATKWDFIPPGDDAESYEILSWRIGSWLASVTGPTVCVSHGGVIRTLFWLVGATPKEIAASADIPQDRILKIDLQAGSIDWI